MDDLISRQAAQAIPPLSKCYREYATSNLDDAYDKGWEDALFSLNALPTIEPMRGKWTKHVLKSANVPWGYDCSACGAWFIVGEDTVEKYDYCPKCGAKMERSEE